MDLLDDARSLGDDLVRLRTELHQDPEVGLDLPRTQEKVLRELDGLGLEISTGTNTTSVTAVLRGGARNEADPKTVLLRADMDALPLTEETGLPFASKVPGVMHACGHDGHTAILLGAARLLQERREKLAGTIKLCFQPAEEGSGGALAMIEAGVLGNPKVDAVFGLHLAQWMPVGKVAARPGAIHAAPARFDVRVQGRGGHAAMPDTAIDTVLVAAEIVVALNRIVSREVRPIDPAVITVATNIAGTTYNIIPDTAVLKGTIRAFDDALRARLAKRVEEVATGIAAAFGATAEVEIGLGPPPVVNDAAMADVVRAAAAEVVGAENVVDGDPTAGADDVAELLTRAPGCYFWVGTRNEAKGIVGDHHHPKFDLDEAALPIGVRVMVGVAERFLAE
jgi:amidohydrolase